MKTFKELINEGLPYTSNEPRPMSVDHGAATELAYTHHATLGKHDIFIHHFVREGNGGYKRMHSEFSVDNKVIKPKDLTISHSDSVKIYHTVKNSMADVIKKNKPHKLEFYAADERYNDVYSKIGKHIAKRFGGSSSSIKGSGKVSVHFNWDKT